MTRREAALGGVLFAVCAGFVGATASVAWYLVHRYLMHDLVFSGLDALWLPFPAFLALSLVVALPWLAALLWRNRPGLWRALVFCVAWCTAFSIGLLFRQFSWWATLILGAGVARLVMLACPEPARLLPRLRRVALVLTAIPVVGLFLSRVVPPGLEAWRDAHLPAAVPGAPNVLWIVIDAQRAENLGLYGYAHPTSPRLDALAASSTVFDWAIAPAPWTLASHASMFSGRAAGQLGVRWFHPFIDDVPRIAQVMDRAGYRTAGFSANISYAGAASGLERGFARYSSRPVSWPRVLRSSPIWNTPSGLALWRARSWKDAWAAVASPRLSRNFFPEGRYRPAAEIARLFLDWQRRRADHPFFAFLNLLDVHEHHRPGPTPPEVMHGTDLNEAGYDEATVYDDSVIGAIVDSLRSRGTLDHTLLVITADHGEHFGEHGLAGHSNSLYMELVRVPLVLRLPGSVPEGRRMATTVSTRDLAATIVDLARVGGSPLPGHSISGAWLAPDTPREPALSEVEQAEAAGSVANGKGPLRSLTNDTWHYIRAADHESLFRYRTDPKEAADVAGDPANAAVLESMRAQLRRIPFGY